MKRKLSLGMALIKVFIGKFHAIDRLSTNTASMGEVTALSHESWNDSVELGALVMKWLTSLANTLFSCAESAEVL